MAAQENRRFTENLGEKENYAAACRRRRQPTIPNIAKALPNNGRAAGRGTGEGPGMAVIDHVPVPKTSGSISQVPLAVALSRKQ